MGKLEDKNRDSSTNRIIVVSLVVLAVFLLITVRIFDYQIVSGTVSASENTESTLSSGGVSAE